MFSSLKIARLFGINVQIHWTFWLLPLWIVLTWQGSPHMFTLFITLLLTVAVFACVVLHEFGHALTAREFGIRTRNITLTPLGGIAQLERMTQKPSEEFWIAVAGPLVNVTISVLLGVPLMLAYAMNPAVAGTSIWSFGFMVLLMNVTMVVFNMIPAFPMDGGRVLRAILTPRFGRLEGTRIAVNVGTVAAILMGIGLWLLIDSLTAPLIAAFVIWAGHQELRALEMEERSRYEYEEAPPIFTRRPHVVVHVWDPRVGAWVRQRDV